MFKRKFPVKTGVFLLVSVFVLSLAKDFPETNAFLKETDTKQVLTSAGDLKVTIKDESPIGDLAINTTHSRELFVKNDGDTDMFVRVLVHPLLENSLGYQLVVNKDTLIPTLTSDWVKGDDEYYYYQKKLAGKSETTAPIFDEFDTSQLAATDNLTFRIKVEAITAKGTTYRNAWWEGVEPSPTDRPTMMTLDAVLLAAST